MWPPCLVRIRNLPTGGGFLCAGGHAEKGRLGTEAEVTASFFSGHACLLQGSGRSDPSGKTALLWAADWGLNAISVPYYL